MKLILRLAAAATLALPVLLIDAPAQALTAMQYKAQGHGRYLYSNGRRMRGYHYGPHWRHWRHHRYHRFYR